MYNYEWDKKTGGYKLTAKSDGTAKKIRPVFFEELNFLGLDKNFGWNFPKSKKPLCWAEGRRYFYRGELVAETSGGDLFELPSLKNVVENLSLSPVNMKSFLSKNADVMYGQIQRTLNEIYVTFQNFRNKVDVFYVAFSGGKDSMVMLDLVQRALPHDSFEVIFGDTTMEISDTYVTVEKAKQKFSDLKWHTAHSPLNAIDSWKLFGSPARKIRWCCSVHKATPSLVKVKEIIAKRQQGLSTEGKNFQVMSFVGVRSEESEKRASYPKISVSHKHSAQINFYPILEWSTAEIFLYTFAENLPLSQSYRNGLPRVGCKFCPMASSWYDCTMNYFYEKETAPYIEIVRTLTNKNFKDEDDFKRYLADRGWAARGSGKVLTIGENKIAVTKNDECYNFEMTNANYSWRDWMPVLGDFIKIDTDKFELQHEGESIVFNVEAKAHKEKISLRVPTFNAKTIKFLSLLKNILNKAAYCVNCRDCVIDCPHDALTITADHVRINNCHHCYKCLNKPKGCLTAWSLEIRGGKNLPAKKIGSYRNFGLKEEWIRIYLEDTKTFWTKGRLGKDMVKSFAVWGKEGRVFDKRKEPTEEFEKLALYGFDSLNLWSYIFINLAYNSNIVNAFVKSANFNEPCNNNFLTGLLEDSYADTTKKDAIQALKSLMRYSPIGKGLGQGICKFKGNAVISITRMAWQNPEPRIILYSLYKFALKEKKVFGFTLTQLLDDKDERVALSPKILFGVDEEILRPILQGLANDYPDFIRVDFNKGIQENIFLNDNKNCNDVIRLF